ncbi:AT-hook motif nuclear-localized protein 10-like isoform X1 [Andrographis paniculata]|uniref:AT-hook motif nuclear-localized protein 10-like isoform X1 n=1 Tax=Andrographis paniculata TaxID=175694 RepID=UPI0021E7B439|nr:AT-hook motif nuclear-localized protein 10-like isoform X1 [Andrographis paniculata]
MTPAAYSNPTTVVGWTCQHARKLRLNPLGSTNFKRFKQHILNFNGGENILRKIRDATTTEPGVVSMKETSWTLSWATICLSVQYCEPTIYKGLFEIVSIVGTFVPFKDGTVSDKKGRMNTTLLCPDGNLFSGRVEDPVITVTPGQISFEVEGLIFLLNDGAHKDNSQREDCGASQEPQAHTLRIYRSAYPHRQQRGGYIQKNNGSCDDRTRGCVRECNRWDLVARHNLPLWARMGTLNI